MKVMKMAIPIILVLNTFKVLQSSTDESNPFDATYTIPIKVVDLEGNPVVGAKIGTGLNVFEDTDRNPPTTKTMWVLTRRRSWPLRSGTQGTVEFIGNRRPKGFYALHEATGMVGFADLSSRGPLGSVTITLEPSCHVHGRIKAGWSSEIDAQLAKTTVFLERSSQSAMYFVSDRGRFEFLLPSGQYELEVYGVTNGGGETKRVNQPFGIDIGQRHLDAGIVTLPISELATLIGKSAPELRHIKGWMNGDPVTIKDLRGKVIVLKFWGYWCGPCISSMPNLIKLYEMYKDNKDVVIIGIHNDSVESIEELKKKLKPIRKQWWNDSSLPFLIALDGGDEGTTSAYGVHSWPTTLLLDMQGKIVKKTDAGPWLKADIDELLTVETK